MTAPCRFFTFGYAGYDSGSVAQAVIAQKAILADIRHTPWSRDPQWRKATVAALLGERYRHVPALGNTSHKTGGTVIADLEAGIVELLALAREHDGPVILMCGCGEYRGCHRAVIADVLRTQGESVVEWGVGQLPLV